MMKVSFGWASWIGVVSAAIAAVIPIVGELAGSVEPLGVSPTVFVYVSAVLTSLTVVGRMAQAAVAAAKDASTKSDK
jgi:NhaP-type Na+/H+ or K+/H+ antiporter